MAKFITLLFILVAYLGPEKVFGPLVQLHVEIIIGTLAILISLPGLLQTLQSAPAQAYALLGLITAVFLSLIANHWFGGAINAVDLFLPQAIPFFLVIFNFKTKRDMQMLVLVLLVVSFVVIYAGYSDLRANNFHSPYLIAQSNDAGQTFYRLRGETFIGDPNDFAQLLVCLIPLTFLFWVRKHRIRNILLVYVPIAGLIFGMFLTHSRGGVIALLAVLLMAARKRLGTIPSSILAGLAFLATTALGWTGGRDISVEQGAGRMDAWAEGLQLVQTNPIFGVGYNRFTEFYYITAHNTIVVCAAELGILGFFFWVLFTVPCFLNSWQVARWQPSLQGKAASANADSIPVTSVEASPIMAGTKETSRYELSTAEIARLGRIMLLTMTGFLVAGWFLSRAYVMTLFVFGGLSEIVFRLAANSGMIEKRLSRNQLLRISSITTIALLVLVYIILRISNLTRF